VGNLILDLFDPNLNYLGVIDNPEDFSFGLSSFEIGTGTLRFNVNANPTYAALLAKNNIVQVNKNPYKAGIITHLSDEIGEDAKGSQYRTASICELKQMFTWRNVMQFNTSNPDWGMSAPAKTVIKNLILDQCGSGGPAPAARQFPNLVIDADQGRGAATVVTGQKYNSMYNILKAIATQAKLAWFCYIDPVGKKIHMDCTLGLDRTGDQSTNPWAVFSTDRGTLHDATVDDDDAQFHNLIYVGGSGSGADRLIQPCYAGSSEPAGMMRREYWDDQSSLTTVAELETQGANDLNQYLQTLSLSGAALPVSPLVYGVDYNLSDTVDVNDGSNTYAVQIIGVSEEWQNASYQISFSWGIPVPSLTRQVFEATNAAKLASSTSETGKNVNASTDIIAAYTLGSGTEVMSVADCIHDILDLGGNLAANATFQLYYDPSSLIGSKSYQVNLSATPAAGGPYSVTITTGVAGASNVVVSQAAGSPTKSFTVNVDASGNVTQSLTMANLTSGSAGGITIGQTKLYVGQGNFNDPATGFYADANGNFSLLDKLSFNGSTGALTVGGVTVASSKLYIGTGTWGNANTPFYVDSSSNFSLGANLTWNGSTLYINGGGVFSGSVSAGAVVGGCLKVGGTSVYIGTGSYATSNTPFYVDSSGNFSLGSAFTWNGVALSVSGTIYASSGTVGGLCISSSSVSYGSGGYQSAALYFDNSGRFSLGSSFYWNGSNNLTIAGNINITGTSSTISGWTLGTSTLKSAASGAYVAADSANMQFAVYDSSGTLRTALGFLGNIPGYTTSQYGVYVAPGNTVVVSSPLTMNAANLVATNASVFIYGSSTSPELQYGQNNGNYGLHFLNGSGSYTALGGLYFDGSGNAWLYNTGASETVSIQSTQALLKVFAYSNGQTYIESSNATNTASSQLNFTGYQGYPGTFEFFGPVGIGTAPQSGVDLALGTGVIRSASASLGASLFSNNVTSLSIGNSAGGGQTYIYGGSNTGAALYVGSFTTGFLQFNATTSGNSLVSYNAAFSATTPLTLIGSSVQISPYVGIGMAPNSSYSLITAGPICSSAGIYALSTIVAYAPVASSWFMEVVGRNTDNLASMVFYNNAQSVQYGYIQSSPAGMVLSAPNGHQIITPSTFAGGAWNANGYTVFGPNATANAGSGSGALGVGFNTTRNQAEIASIAPGYAWLPLGIYAGSIAYYGPALSSTVFSVDGLGDIAAAGNITISGTGSHQLGGSGAIVGVGQAAVAGYSMSVAGNMGIGGNLYLSSGHIGIGIAPSGSLSLYTAGNIVSLGSITASNGFNGFKTVSSYTAPSGATQSGVYIGVYNGSMAGLTISMSGVIADLGDPVGFWIVYAMSSSGPTLTFYVVGGNGGYSTFTATAGNGSSFCSYMHVVW
jgi:hypothetical protein